MSRRLRIVSALMGPAALLAGPAFAAGVEYTGRAYPDPFAEAASGARVTDEQMQMESRQKTLSSLTVQGIVLSAEGHMAMINGKVARKDDTLLGFRIHSIEPDGVWVHWAAEPDGKFYKLPHKKGTLQ